MKTQIQDEFTNLSISRQRKYQLRKKRDLQCTECGRPALKGSRCLEHLVQARELQRRMLGLKRRYLNTLSYKLESLLASGSASAKKADRAVGRPGVLLKPNGV